MKNWDKQIIWLCVVIAVCIGTVTWGKSQTLAPYDECKIISVDKKVFQLTVICPEKAFNGVIDYLGGVVGQDKGSEFITLSTEKKKRTSKLPHWSHQARIDCKTCHNLLPEKWTKNIGHKLCKGCHKLQKVSTKCKTCHGKKKKKAYEGC